MCFTLSTESCYLKAKQERVADPVKAEYPHSVPKDEQNSDQLTAHML